jgi:hypothetical protein
MPVRRFHIDLDQLRNAHFATWAMSALVTGGKTRAQLIAEAEARFAELKAKEAKEAKEE